MEDLSITQGCSAATTAIRTTAPTLRSFIREVREARLDLDAVLAELHSLEGVLLDLEHEYDTSSTVFPNDLAQRTPPLLDHCASIVRQIDGYMHVCNGLGLTRRDKKFRWLAIRGDMVKLRLTLEGYKSILAMVTDLVGLTTSCHDNDNLSITSSSSQSAREAQACAQEELGHDLTRVLADMGGLRGRLQGDFRSNYAVSDLASYLDAMQLHATNLGYRLDQSVAAAPPEIPRKSAERHSSSSVGDEPDSAIDMNDDLKALASPYAPSSPSASPRAPASAPLPTVEIEEYLDELNEQQQPTSRAPTPPPRAQARRGGVQTQPSFRLSTSASHGALRTEALLDNHPSATLTPFSTNHLPGLSPRPSSARSLSEYSAMHHDADGNPIVPRRVSSLRSLSGSADARSTVGSLRAIRSPYDDNVREDDFWSRSVVTTTIVGGAAAAAGNEQEEEDNSQSSLMRRTSKLFGRKNSFRTVPTVRPGSSPMQQNSHHQKTSSASSNDYMAALQGPGLLYNPVEAARTASLRTKPSTISPAPTLSVHSYHPRKVSVDTTNTTTTTTKSSASIRSNASRLSSVFTRMSLWRPQTSASTSSSASSKAARELALEPDAIFGVSLKKSMLIAAATVRTHHGSDKASSRRDFPRCILACTSFIKEHNGVRTPHIFGEDGDPHRVAALKEAFSTAPWYGEGNIAWNASNYTVHDAAALIMLFLQLLRRPLISETVARRWVALSRQATLPGSLGRRLDACLDFWDEALLGVGGGGSSGSGSAGRSLLKLLLNLWGDVADAADENDMTAERLAARLLGPLMHLPPGKYTTDYMLGLAFLIRKRSEYAIMLREGRQSHAAF